MLSSWSRVRPPISISWDTRSVSVALYKEVMRPVNTPGMPSTNIEAALDNPEGSPEQLFALMLLRRIENLEASDVQKDASISSLEARIRRLELKTYSAEENEFNDGFFIDWFLWEPVDSAHVCRSGSLFLMLPGDMYSSADVVMPFLSGYQSDDLELHVPVARHEDISRTIKLPRDLDVCGLLSRIHAFYQTPITSLDIADRDKDPSDGYLEDVRKMLDKGERAVWADLLGSSSYGPGCGGSDGSTNKRRHGFSCSGLVRFEGIRVEDNKLLLILGS